MTAVKAARPAVAVGLAPVTSLAAGRSGPASEPVAPVRQAENTTAADRSMPVVSMAAPSPDDASVAAPGSPAPAASLQTSAGAAAPVPTPAGPIAFEVSAEASAPVITVSATAEPAASTNRASSTAETVTGAAQAVRATDEAGGANSRIPPAARVDASETTVSPARTARPTEVAGLRLRAQGLPEAGPVPSIKVAVTRLAAVIAEPVLTSPIATPNGAAPAVDEAASRLSPASTTPVKAPERIAPAIFAAPIAAQGVPVASTAGDPPATNGTAAPVADTVDYVASPAPAAQSPTGMAPPRPAVGIRTGDGTTGSIPAARAPSAAVMASDASSDGVLAASAKVVEETAGPVGSPATAPPVPVERPADTGVRGQATLAANATADLVATVTAKEASSTAGPSAASTAERSRVEAAVGAVAEGTAPAPQTLPKSGVISGAGAEGAVPSAARPEDKKPAHQLQIPADTQTADTGPKGLAVAYGEPAHREIGSEVAASAKPSRDPAEIFKVAALDPRQPSPPALTASPQVATDRAENDVPSATVSMLKGENLPSQGDKLATAQPVQSARSADAVTDEAVQTFARTPVVASALLESQGTEPRSAAPAAATADVPALGQPVRPASAFASAVAPAVATPARAAGVGPLVDRAPGVEAISAPSNAAPPPATPAQGAPTTPAVGVRPAGVARPTMAVGPEGLDASRPDVALEAVSARPAVVDPRRVVGSIPAAASAPAMPGAEQEPVSAGSEAPASIQPQASAPVLPAEPKASPVPTALRVGDPSSLSEAPAPDAAAPAIEADAGAAAPRDPSENTGPRAAGPSTAAPATLKTDAASPVSGVTAAGPSAVSAAPSPGSQPPAAGQQPSAPAVAAVASSAANATTAAAAVEATRPAAKAPVSSEARAADRPAAATQRPAGAPVGAASSVQADLTATAVKAIHGVSAAAAAFVTRLRGDAKAAAADGAADAAQAVATAPQTLGASLAVVAAPNQPAQSRPRVPVARLGAEIAKVAAAGETKFDVKLDPVGLGGVDVSLTFTDDGDVHAHLSVERPETLDLLARDQRQIEKTLRDAGFDARDGAVSLSMRQNGGEGERQAQQRAYQPQDQTRTPAGRSGESDVRPRPSPTSTGRGAMRWST